MAAAPDPALASDAFLRLIPRDFAREHQVLAQGPTSDGAAEWVAVGPAAQPSVLWNCGVRLGRPVQALPAVDAGVIVAAIDAAYERNAARADDAAEGPHVIAVDAEAEDIDRILAEADRDLLASSGKAPLVRLLDRLVFSAISRGASDLHLQPSADTLLVRQRIDGVLDQGRPLPLALHRPLVSRVKVMGRMDVAERLVPQDGRTSVRVGDRAIDVRISTIPTAYGERVVLRLLDTGQQPLDLTALGMPATVSAAFRGCAARSSGIVLVTGPTGSGKTTTLYATLRGLDAVERNILTIEDPIEYELSSLGIPISQSQVNPRKGVNFANGLRHILRQDPDIIMVGEIRDAETARIAIQASLTGHLVFSTLHTNDAVSAVSRLMDLGVEPYLVSASLSAVLAQRLVRCVCPACAGAAPLPDAPPCERCQGSGFQGRTGVFELLVVDQPLRDAISARASLAELRVNAQRAGMRTLAEAGADLVQAGRTTPTEIERVIHHA